MSRDNLEKRIVGLEAGLGLPQQSKRYILKVDKWPTPTYMLMEKSDGDEGDRFIRNLTPEEVKANE